MITLSIKIDCEIMMHVEMDFVKVFFVDGKQHQYHIHVEYTF